MRFLSFITLILLSTVVSMGQKISNVRAVLDGKNIKILYDLEYTDPAGRFDIRIYASHNDFKEPLIKVTGAAGKGIKPGKDLTILWNAQEELVNFYGEIVFEVRGTVLGGYYLITTPAADTKFKRGKLLPVSWQGGENLEKVKIELVKSGQTIATISEKVENRGNYVWTIPKSIKPSKYYRVKIYNTLDVESQGISKIFTVKGKSAAPYILIPLLVGGGAAAYLYMQDDGPEPITPENPDLLPLPPNPD